MPAPLTHSALHATRCASKHPMLMSANPYAEKVSGEPRKRVVILRDLYKPAHPDTLSAAITHSGEFGGTVSGYQVAAMPVVLEADALALVALGAGAGADLVELGGIGAGRDKPTPAALVGVKDLLTVKLEDTEPSQDVARNGFAGSGFLGRSRYTGVGHEATPSWSGPRDVPASSGPLLYLTPVLSHKTGCLYTLVCKVFRVCV